MHKRGQATLFVILGIVIVIIIALIFLFVRTPTVGPAQTSTEATSDFIEFTRSCVDEVGREALILIGRQGGFFEPRQTIPPYVRNSPTYGIYDVNSWGVGQTNVAPTNEIVAEQVELYFLEFFNDCIDDYSSYTSEGWTVETGILDVKTDFRDGETALIVTYPVTATKANEEAQFEGLDPVEIPWDVKKALETGRETITLFAATGGIPSDYIINKGYNLVNFNENNGQTLVFRLMDYPNDEERKYVLIFAIS